MVLVRTLTNRDNLFFTGVTATAASALSAVGTRLSWARVEPPPPQSSSVWRLVPVAARSLVSDARRALPFNAASLLLGAAVGATAATAATAAVLFAQRERRARRSSRRMRSALAESLADEANRSAAQPLLSPSQRSVLVQVLLRWLSATPASFDGPAPFSKGAPPETRAAALLLARVHARLALARLHEPPSAAPAAPVPADTDAAAVAGGAPCAEATACAAGCGGGGCAAGEGAGDALSHEESCKVCWGARANTIYAPCGHVVACLECTARLRRLCCPVCQANVSDVIQLFTT